MMFLYEKRITWVSTCNNSSLIFKSHDCCAHGFIGIEETIISIAYHFKNNLKFNDMNLSFNSDIKEVEF